MLHETKPKIVHASHNYVKTWKHIGKDYEEMQTRDNICVQVGRA